MIRVFDFVFSLIGIIILTPLFIIIGIMIKLNSNGNVIYKQNRVGLNNVDFFVLKFRTMFIKSDSFGTLTVGGRDPRITSIGYYLRKYKLDVLPELINVLLGQMSLVGPRPEVRKYVNLDSEDHLKVLNIRPGITDWASIIYRNENIILERSSDPENDYINIIMPDKKKYNLIYINNYNLLEYFRIIFSTIIKILIPKFEFNIVKNI